MEAIDILIERVAHQIDKLGKTERWVSMEATGAPDAIRYIRKRRAMPSAARLSAIARVLQATPEWLIGDSESNNFDIFLDYAAELRKKKTKN